MAGIPRDIQLCVKNDQLPDALSGFESANNVQYRRIVTTDVVGKRRRVFLELFPDPSDMPRDGACFDLQRGLNSSLSGSNTDRSFCARQKQKSPRSITSGALFVMAER